MLLAITRSSRIHVADHSSLNSSPGIIYSSPPSERSAARAHADEETEDYKPPARSRSLKPPANANGQFMTLILIVWRHCMHLEQIPHQKEPSRAAT